MPRWCAISRGLLGDRCTTNPTQLEHHGHGESWHAPGAPDVVVFPLSTDEVSAVVRAAARHGAPVVPFGAGSSLEGHVNPVHGGVSLDLSRMNRVLRVSAEDLDATVEAGVTHRQLNKALANTGAAFWVDPGADATIGGMAATRASGTTAVRYGTMREAVLGPDGGARRRPRDPHRRARAQVVGRLRPHAPVRRLGRHARRHHRDHACACTACPRPCRPPSARSTRSRARCATVITTIQFGIPVARIELLDEVQIDAVNRYSKLSYAVKPTLLFEFHATSAAGAAEHATAVQEIAAEHGGTEFRWATTTEDRATLWAARHNTYYAALAMRPGGKAWVTDVCVPISALAECIVETKRDLRGVARLRAARRPRRRRQLPPEFRARSRTTRARWPRSRRSTRGWCRARSRLGGTCTGEHGIGLGKQQYLLEEHGEDAVGVMRAIKQALDPAGIMNPGRSSRVGSRL